VLRGEAGIGKTALLRYAAMRSSGLGVMRIAGMEAEMELPFAAVHQPCAPMLARADTPPEPQRRALDVAFGLAAGHTPDRFLVALTVLSVLSIVSGDVPLCCFIDDAQWLDPASTQVLGVVARRPLAEPVALVFALREPVSRPELEGLAEVRLDGLADSDAHALLAKVIPDRLEARARDRIVAARGSPLALLELPRGISPADWRAGSGCPRHGILRAGSRRSS
jgi:AAA ATPase-like protein